MPGMNYREIATMVAQLSPVLTGGRIQSIFMTIQNEIAIDVRVPGNNLWLLISLERAFSRIHLISGKPVVPQTPPAFCMALRKYLVGGRIAELSAEPGERIVSLWIEKADGSAGLIAELFGPASNAFLVGNDANVVEIFNRKLAGNRGLNPGSPYMPPQSPGKKPDVQLRDFGPDPQEFFQREKKQRTFLSAKKGLVTRLTKEIRRAEKYAARMQSDISRLEDPEFLQKCGELLSIHRNQIKKGAESYITPDLYSPDQQEIEIALDVKKGPGENVEAYFKRAKKNRLREKGLSNRISEMEEALLDFYDLRDQLDQTGDLEALEPVKEQMVRRGLAPAQSGLEKKSRKAAVPSGPRRYISADGLAILVGRNNRENDELTFRIARGNDYWLHALGVPGSHVIIKMDKNAVLKQETLLDAATLALANSKISKQGRGDVSYTQRKYVTKPKGAPPGKVTPSQTKTIHVIVEPDRLKRLTGKGEINY